MTSFNWRYPAAMQRLHTMAAAGFLGRVFHVNVRWLGGRWADEEAPITWRMDRAQAGHGAMGDMGVHAIDLIRWSFGEFKQLSAQAGIAYPGRTVPGTGKIVDSEDFCSVTAELVSGAQVNMFTSRAARGTSEQTLEAYGTDGALQYRLDREKPRWWRGELRAAAKGSGFAPVKVPAGLPKSAGEGDPLEVIGQDDHRAAREAVPRRHAQGTARRRPSTTACARRSSSTRSSSPLRRAAGWCLFRPHTHDPWGGLRWNSSTRRRRRCTWSS